MPGKTKQRAAPDMPGRRTRSSAALLERSTVRAARAVRAALVLLARAAVLLCCCCCCCCLLPQHSEVMPRRSERSTNLLLGVPAALVELGTGGGDGESRRGKRNQKKKSRDFSGAASAVAFVSVCSTLPHREP